MSFMSKKFLFSSLFAVSCMARSLFAQEAQAAAGEESQGLDPLLKAEIAYAEALTAFGFPDFAAEVIADTKKKWPESDAIFVQ